MKKHLKAIFAAFVSALCLTLCAGPVTALAANEDDTLILSGRIEGNVEPGLEIRKIVLDNAEMAEGTVLSLKAPAVIEIRDGTKNTICGIEAVSMAEFTGAGELEITGAILEIGYELLFNHTGKITVNGMFACADGSVIINSGTIDINASDIGGSGLSAMNSDVYMNGGVLNISSKGSAIGAIGSIIIRGGTVNASSAESIAFLAGGEEGAAIEIAEGVSTGGLTVQTIEDAAGTSCILAGPGGSGAPTAALEGPDDEKSIEKANSDFEKNTEGALTEAEKLAEEAAKAAEEEAKAAADTEGSSMDAPDAESAQDGQTGTSANKDKTENNGSKSLLIIIAVLVVIAAVVASAATAGQKKNRGNKKR